MGGSPLVFWGFMAMILVALATGVSLAELASAIPHAGGQYVWVQQLAPGNIRRGLSYSVAVASWLGAVATSASTCLSAATSICDVIAFLRPDFVYQRWMGFVVFQLLNLVTLLLSCFEHALPHISRAVLATSFGSVVAVFIGLFATSSQHATTAGFFLTKSNTSGWSDGVAFLIGLGGINWSLCSLDVVTHLADEIPSPSTNIPKALMWTVAVGFVAGMMAITAVFINVPVIDPGTSNSALALFYRISGSKAVAMGLWMSVLVAIVGSLCSIHIWQSRIAWTISREGGFPLNRHLRRIFPPPFSTPVWSLVWSATCCFIFSCLYLGSEQAFNSLISTGILLQYISYSTPVVLMLARGRSTVQHGPFWYPRLGLVANLVMLAWTVVAVVFYCFPYQIPVEAHRMNYVSVVLALVAGFVCVLWFTYARENYAIGSCFCSA
jgi:choline transport protein